MSEILKPGQSVRTQSSGLERRVEKFLGAGTQGEVYRATLSGQPMALKWYLPAFATADQRAGLETLVRRGAPTDRFLWPIELSVAPGVYGFGYVMQLRPARYKASHVDSCVTAGS